MWCELICIRCHKMQLKAPVPCCSWICTNGCMTFVMMRSRWNGQRALITCFDGVGLKRLSALSSENPAKVTNWKRRGVRGMCDPLTPPSMRCVNERHVLLLSTPANRPHFDLKQYSEGQTTDEKFC